MPRYKRPFNGAKRLTEWYLLDYEMSGRQVKRAASSLKKLVSDSSLGQTRDNVTAMRFLFAKGASGVGGGREEVVSVRVIPEAGAPGHARPA